MGRGRSKRERERERWMGSEEGWRYVELFLFLPPPPLPSFHLARCVCMLHLRGLGAPSLFGPSGEPSSCSSFCSSSTSCSYSSDSSSQYRVPSTTAHPLSSLTELVPFLANISVKSQKLTELFPDTIRA